MTTWAIIDIHTDMEEIRRISSEQIEVLNSQGQSIHQAATARARQAYVSIKRISPLTALILTPVFIAGGLLLLPLIFLIFTFAFFFARHALLKVRKA